MRILLIDDNPDDRALARRALGRELPNLEIAEIADAALLDQALEAGGFEAVITDYHLRWSDGLAVLRRAKERFPDCPVIMFTGTGSEEIAVEAMKSGLDDYVVKTPHHYVRLPTALRSALARAAERRYTASLESRFQTLLDREREARLAAEAASLMKDEFLATLSHELRTPLNAIVGWTRLLKTGSLEGEKLRRAVETIERNAFAQARLIEGLLDISAIVSGKMTLDVRPVDLAPVVEAALESVRPAADAKGIRLEMALDPAPGLVPGDAARLQQVVWNLLSNAVKFTPPGGFVRVELERLDSRVRLGVRDSGIGIDPAFLPSVFEPFRQADSSMTRAQGGLGLGLAIVRRLVELHGGSVGAESGGLGHGAAFTVELPRQTREPERRSPASPMVPESLDRAPDLQGLRVLVVDDEADTRELIAVVLRQRGAEVLPVGSAAETRQVWEGFRPGLLISDIAMAGEDGYELIRWVRRLPPERGGRLPAVAVTAYARSEDRRRALLAGYNLHLSKPFDPDELVAVAASLTDRVSQS
jgi:signal transduction histidine kinase